MKYINEIHFVSLGIPIRFYHDGKYLEVNIDGGVY